MAGQGLSIQELMTLYGYTFSGSCQCDGFLTLKYRKGEYELKWRKNRYMFRMFKNRQPEIPWTKLTELENYINELHGESNKVSP